LKYTDRQKYLGVILLKKKKEKIVTDPFGSYTGRGLDPMEKPVQDADDL